MMTRRSTSPPYLSSCLQHIPFKAEVFILSLGFFVFLYAVFVFQLFPNGDCFNAFVMTYCYAISCFLKGIIPFWDPMVACGVPFYFSFFTAGFLDPLFAISVFLGKIFFLNILQIYMMWIILRGLLFLIGMFWLLKQLSRHSAISLLGAIFSYFSIGICLFRDCVGFAVYWPLLLASLIYFLKSLKKETLSFLNFYLSLLLFALSIVSGNFGYVFLLLSVLAIAACVIAPKEVSTFLKLLFKKVSVRHWLTSFILLALVLAPFFVIAYHYRTGEYFAYLRVHQAHRNIDREISNLTDGSLDYLNVNFDESPIRRGREFSAAFFPFLYQLPQLADGTIYFGLLAFLGLLAGLFFRPRKTFLIYFLSGIFIAFLMTWSAGGVLTFLKPLWPFLKFINQRQMFYPAFLICMTVAGSLGLKLFFDFRMLKKIFKYITILHLFLMCILLILGLIVFVMLTSFDLQESFSILSFVSWRLCAAFLIAAGLLVFLIKHAIDNPRYFRAFVCTLFVIYLLDFSFFSFHLLNEKCPTRNRGLWQKSESLRKPVEIIYEAFRSPLIAATDGGTHTCSVAHLFNLRSALPAYWDCGLLFSTKRYYELFSALDSEKLKTFLGISSPVLRFYPEGSWQMAKGDALNELANIKNDDSVILEESDSVSNSVKSAWTRLMRVPLSPRKYFPSRDLEAKALENSFYMKLFDRKVSIPEKDFHEVSQGIYHERVFRADFPAGFQFTFDSGRDLLSRYFFPEFPLAGDFNGDVYFASTDRKTLLKVISGVGILLEGEGGKIIFPTKMYSLDRRAPFLSEIQVTNFGPNRVDLKINSPKAGILLYGDLYDSHWRATVDGKPAKVVIGNHAFKAVNVPSGEHQVAWVYQVKFLSLALLMYSLGLFGFLSVAVYFSRNKRRKSEAF